VTVTRQTKSPARWQILCGLAFAAASVALQKLLFTVLAADSYQLLLFSVAAGVLYAGLRAGLAALVFTALAQSFFFLSFQGQDRPTAARFVLFLALGLLICGLGHKLSASEKKLKLLSGLLPICASCKRIRDSQDQWRQLEIYIRDHSEADFTHSLCPQCERLFLE